MTENAKMDVLLKTVAGDAQGNECGVFWAYGEKPYMAFTGKVIRAAIQCEETTHMLLFDGKVVRITGQVLDGFCGQDDVQLFKHIDDHYYHTTAAQTLEEPYLYLSRCQCTCGRACDSLHSAAEKSCGSCILKHIYQVGNREFGAWALFKALHTNGSQLAVRVLKGFKEQTARHSITDLMCCAFLGDEVSARRLIGQAGQKTTAGFTALMIAARHGHPRLVKMLGSIEHGMTSQMGWTALLHSMWMNAASSERKKCVRELVKYADEQPGDVTDLMIAAYLNGNDLAIKYERQLFFVDRDERSALHYAVMGASVRATFELSSVLGQPKDKQQKTPLFYTLEEKQAKLLRIFAANQSDTSVRDAVASSALLQKAKRSNSKSKSRLLYPSRTQSPTPTLAYSGASQSSGYDSSSRLRARTPLSRERCFNATLLYAVSDALAVPPAQRSCFLPGSNNLKAKQRRIWALLSSSFPLAIQ